MPNANDDPMKTEGGKPTQPVGDPPFTPTNPPPKQNPVTRKDPPPRSLSVRATRHYGAIDIEFGVAATFTVENEADQERLWRSLWQQVNDMHDSWAENELPHVNKVKPPKQAAPENANDEYVLQTRNVVNGAYKFISVEPRYAKFGASASADMYNQVDALMVDHPGKAILFAVRGGKVLKVWADD